LVFGDDPNTFSTHIEPHRQRARNLVYGPVMDPMDLSLLLTSKSILADATPVLV
jgi:hypothetical protein